MSRRRPSIELAIAVLAVSACSNDRGAQVVASQEPWRGVLASAIGRFVEQGRTPHAYRELARSAAALALDELARREARIEIERRMVILAVWPVESVHHLPPAGQTDALAVTVWPTLLAPPFDEPANAGAFAATAGETPDRYVARICSEIFPRECGQLPADQQGVALAAVAYERAATRADHAIERCDECRKDATWHEAERRWDLLKWRALQWRASGSSAAGTSGKAAP